MTYVVVKNEPMPGLVTQWARVEAFYGHLVIAEHIDMAKDSGRHFRCHRAENLVFFNDEKAALNAGNAVTLAWGLWDDDRRKATERRDAKIAEIARTGAAA